MQTSSNNPVLDTVKGSVLVTGSGGLLGRAVLQQLIGGKRVIYPVFRNMPGSGVPGGLEPLVQDLSGTPDFSSIPVPETIVHLAQSAGYRNFPDSAQDVFDVNIASTQKLLGWGQQNGVKRIVLASSGGIYNDAKSFSENTPLKDTFSFNHYLATKRCAELLAGAYRDTMTVVILRFFFIYGPEQRPFMLIPRLINCVRDGASIQLQQRDGLRFNPVYVTDAAAAVEAALELDESQIINVAGPEVVSMRQVGELIGERTGHSPSFDIDQSRSPDDIIGNIEKMSRLLTRPEIGVRQGLDLMLSKHEASQEKN
ncbi:NAD-dependent epimerase/dehydratase family protein [Thalassospira sp. SM2505]